MMLLLLLAPALLAAQANWTVPPEFAAAGYRKEILPEGILLSGPGPSGALTETFDATPYRGLPVRLRASVRVEGGGKAQLQLRVDRPDGKLAFFDNMGDRPITSRAWTQYDVSGEVAPDAESIEVGVLSFGTAPVWVKDISFEKLPPSAPETDAARREIAEIYARVDSAYATANLRSIADLATADAEIVLPSGPVSLRTAFSQMAGAKFQSRSEVTAARVDGPRATVWVNNESAGGAQAVFSSNRDEWLKTGAGWKLRRSTVIAMRAATPAEVLAEIPQRAGQPTWANVRIIVCNRSPALEIAGFQMVSTDVDPAAAAQRALAYLKGHAPDEAGPAALAFQGTDAARIAAVVRAFDRLPHTAEWRVARHDAGTVYQALTASTEERLASHIIWIASEEHPTDKLMVVAPPGSLPALRRRYGKQVYAIGVVPRELLGGAYFLDIASIPPETALGRWLAAQKFPYDGMVGE